MNGDGISQRERRGSSIGESVGDETTTASATSLVGMNLISKKLLLTKTENNENKSSNHNNNKSLND